MCKGKKMSVSVKLQAACTFENTQLNRQQLIYPLGFRIGTGSIMFTLVFNNGAEVIAEP